MYRKLVKVDLPPPQTDHWDWQKQGACRSMPIALFFPSDTLRGCSLRRSEREAKLVCAQCPVIELCLEHAISSKEPYGVWGGLNPRERLELSELKSPNVGNPDSAKRSTASNGRQSSVASWTEISTDVVV
ncbi:WhiB family transcriptional regulator [Rhodococcus sp. NPDC079359]|uniref:WhiB family transcriptional regulator n=1 Tax=Nocardiaceae TaxID=85025 RepID=UPI0009B7EFEE|nr:WhiB family transcriptional regulator [Rhodococcus fascians]